MKVEVKKSTLSGRIKAIPSKSYVHRLMICAFLAGEDFNLGGFLSDDMKATLNCLSALKRNERVLDCGESGSTLRFILSLAGTIGGEFTFAGRGKLMERPNDALFVAFADRGVKCEQGGVIKLSGKLTAGEYKIRGDISSQYISGLLMALPALDGDSEIVLTSPLVSAPYVDITLEVLKSFGVRIDKTQRGFKVYGGQVYKSAGAKPEGDWSNMAFFLVAGAICGDLKISGLNSNSVQADRFILQVLNLAGARVEWNGDEVSVSKSALNAFTFDAEDCPDIVPVSAVLAAFAKGKSVIKNISRLKIKESNRIVSTIELLAAFGVKAECVDNDLCIYGCGEMKNGVVNSYNDHRIAMSAAVAACAIEGASVINDAGAVNKSYPTFYDDLKSVGGVVYEI